jgi:hypothetical protein
MTQDTFYPHIFLNLNHMVGYDMSSDDWQKLTVSQLRLSILMGAVTICHEFAHAIIQTHFSDMPSRPHMNAEVVSEDGCSFENYVLGGITATTTDDEGHPNHLMVRPWPHYEEWVVYCHGQNVTVSDVCLRHADELSR